MEDTIYKISNDFTVSWDPKEISAGFPTIKHTDQSPYHNPNGAAHWQLYPSNIMFGRNFYANYKAECMEVVAKLKSIRDKLRVDQYVPVNYLTNAFLNHEINPGKVNLLKTIPGKDIKVHCDVTRDICINIGLKNSNKWATVISEDPTIKNFESSQKQTFLMNDGDAYIILINNPHTAICLNKFDLESTRYLITYTISVPNAI